MPGRTDLSIDAGLALVRALGAPEHWLAVLVTLRADGTPSVSVVNAGILPSPVTGAPVVGLVARGATAKLANLRRDPRATLVFRAGWEWVAVSGPAALAGPDDPLRASTRPACRSCCARSTRPRAGSTPTSPSTTG